METTPPLARARNSYKARDSNKARARDSYKAKGSTKLETDFNKSRTIDSYKARDNNKAREKTLLVVKVFSLAFLEFLSVIT